MLCLSQRLAARRQTLHERREQERRVAELLEERGQSMAEQVACVDTLLRQAPVRQDPSRRRELHYIHRLSMGRAVAAAQAPLGEVEELTSTEASTQAHQESRRAAWQASVRRLVLVGGLAAHARPETGQGTSEAEEESDDDGDGKDEPEHEESEERQESKDSEENGVGGLMPTAAGSVLAEEEEPEDGLQDELDPDAIVRQYLQHVAEADEP